MLALNDPATSKLDNIDLDAVHALRGLDVNLLSQTQKDKFQQISQGIFVSTPLDRHVLSSFLDDGVVDETGWRDVQFEDEESFQAIFALDPWYKSIRRLRATHVYRATIETSKPILGYLTHMRYSTVCNIMIWAHIWGVDEFMWAKSRGLFNSHHALETRGSSLSAYVKRFGEDSKLKRCYAEISTVEGHISDSPEWDLRAECENLATHSGGTRPVGWEVEWTEALRTTIPPALHYPKWVEMEEYVKSGAWITAGSCSVGKVDWTYDGKTGHFKANKGQFATIYSAEEVWDIVSNWDGCIRSTAIVKNEAGKMRLAVASNIESYIHEAYILDMYGHDYKQWPHMTMEESPREEGNRTVEMARQLETCWAMPWDFRRFDHQVLIFEIQAMLMRMRDNYLGVTGNEAMRGVWDKVITSYEKATLSYRPKPGAEPIVLRVIASLLSGQRTTSLVGNVWNSNVTECAVRRANSLLGRPVRPTLGIRGDDTYVLAQSPAECLALRWAYASVNAVGHNDKFSIRQTSVEFLRNEIYANKRQGWPNRTITSITQRKPWAGGSYGVLDDVATIASNINNLGRRLNGMVADMTSLHRANKVQWSKYTRMTYMWLELPVRLGGAGIYEWRGFVPNRKVSLRIQPDDVSIQTPLRGDVPQWVSELGVAAEAYNRVKMSNMIVPGAIPGRISNVINGWKRATGIAPIKWRRVVVPYDEVHTPKDIPSALAMMKKPKPDLKMDSVDPTYPPFLKFLSQWNDSVRMGTGESLASITKLKYPLVYSKLKGYERRGYHRTDAINLILGKQPTESIEPLNSNLSGFVSATVKLLIDRRMPYGRVNIGRALYASTRAAVHNAARTDYHAIYLF